MDAFWGDNAQILFHKDRAVLDLSSVAESDLPCKKPTIDNPFMNPLLMDPPTSGACASPGTQEEAAQLLDEHLFYNVDDLFSRASSARMFNTVPSSTKIPDTAKFSNWLIKGADKAPIPFGDLRQQRRLIDEDVGQPPSHPVGVT
ncbi:hypothetical protein HDU78_005245 [Chytriomyces hyalinus]|nr:hypothetical protein HDU78_005245 [Chytriomyces hyalinus]